SSRWHYRCLSRSKQGCLRGGNPMDTDLQPTEQSLSDKITSLSDTIHSCERLCLLTARTVLLCAVPTSSDGHQDSGRRAADEVGNTAEDVPPSPVAFISSVSRNLHNVPTANSRNPHPTTSAHCVTALQSLVPLIGRFQLGTHESKGLAFHPIE